MENMNVIYKTILGSGLREFKYLNSHLKPVGHKEEMKGSIFGFREKEALKVGRGVILTSIEAMNDNTDSFTHWTPNVYRYGKKREFGGIVEGYNEKNLRQINTFVIDIDSKSVNWSEILLLGLEMGFMPTMILETPKGYQVYHVLSRPAFVTSKTNYKVIDVAKKISRNLKKAYALKFKVDMGCNDFGIARVPRKDNVLFFDQDYRYSFGEWLNWSLKQSDSLLEEAKEPKMRLVRKSDRSRQIDEPWFDMLLHRGQIRGQKGVLGRNNAILTLALAFFSSGKEKENCEFNLYQFNGRLSQPLREVEVKRIIDSAYSGKYKAAQRAYITQLIQTWVDSSLTEAELFTSKTGWYKFARPREERTNSHFKEREADLLAYLRKKCTVDKPYLTCTSKEMAEDLGMSLSTFKTIKKRLVKSNKIKATTTLGRNGSTTLVLLALFVVGVISKNKARKHFFINHVAKLLEINCTELERTVTLFTHNESDVQEQGEQLKFLGVNTS